MNQFIDQYTNLGYLEAITLNSLEIVKFKIKNRDIRQILLISNENCFTVKTTIFPNKKVNDFIVNSTSVNEIGKIILKNNESLTLQRGRPYFFPNCRIDEVRNQSTLQYKILSSNRVYSRSKTERSVFLNYYDLMKLSVQKSIDFKNFLAQPITLKSEFSKLFFKKNGKLYSSLIPEFVKKFSITNSKQNTKYNQILKPKLLLNSIYGKMDRNLLMQSSDILKNTKLNSNNYELTFIKFLEYPFTKVTKSVGIYSITEDYFEQDFNSVFCKNSEFIDTGETIGLLKLEKEITGDIVQGLPRIEEILEARKKNLNVKKIPTSQKKGLLIQKTNLDPNFEFRKLGTPVKENDKINPHKLLKVYFNYYGLIKLFISDNKKQLKYTRLIQNYEGSYKSFKKVQSFILTSVQSVYKSQGVSINDKHLEVIIKQMTTKVLITYEGNTPLLRREVIDLYHIQYINEIVKRQGKQSAYYVPLLLGITKAALNNPSFISAASFQETTRVLTKAAIEGRIDWLRGLKENIIIGHLIPSGTGSHNYRNCFKKSSLNFNSRFETVSNN
jgi:sporulation protein YlmC with PRC-barrel domain